MIKISLPKTLNFRTSTNLARPKFSIEKASARTRSVSGFSLIELLIVIGLIALIMSIGVPNFGMALKINLSKASREMATLIRSTHDEAVLKGQVYRLAFDIDKNQFWVEVGNRDFLMRSSEQEEQEYRRNERRTKEDQDKHKEHFSLASAVTKKKLNLPTGVKFTEITTAHSKESAKGGTTYAHVFPHGFVEKLIIHLKDDFNRENTLVVSSVTGKSTLFERFVRDEELQ